MNPDIRAWRAQFAQRFGEQPDQNSPSYDYRGAVTYGVYPSAYAHDAGMYHWGSMAQTPTGQTLYLKSPQHSTRWKQAFMEQYGVNPDEIETGTPEQTQYIANVATKQSLLGDW